MKVTSFGALKSLNSKYNAFTLLRKPKSLLNEGTGPLEGTTTALKDLFCTKGELTTCSSKILESFVAPYDSTVATLLNAAGTHIVGKTNMDEFAMGNSTTNSYFGPTVNPLYYQPTDGDMVLEYQETDDYLIPKTVKSEIPSHQKIIGGSSGGSACAVAADMVDFSIGSDTGGSVRLPAAYTGIYGFKPTYGRISRWGMVPYAQSLDTVGIFSKNIGDIWKVFGVLDLHDENDPTSISEELRDQVSTEWMKQTWVEERKVKRIGVPDEFLLEDMNPEVRIKWLELLDVIREQGGHEIVSISVPSIKQSLEVYYTLVTAEAASNLAKYDGNRYGYKKNNYVETRTEGFGDEVKQRITLGNFTLSSYGYESHYMKAMNMRSQLINEFNAVFSDQHVLTKTSGVTDGVDFIISPTTIDVPPSIEEFNKMTNVESYTNDVLTVPASLAGLPALNIPFQGHGFQIIGQHAMDYKVLQFAHSLNMYI